MVSQEYRVEGPIALFLSTTAVDLDEELLNRCIVLTVDEDREQTRAIHRLQRERQTLEGMLAGQARDRILVQHQNAQRLLRPLLVANPYAPKLTFLDAKTRTRRDHLKYLTLIRAVTLLHQHQRPIHRVTREGKEASYIEVTPEDIRIANELADRILGRSLDETPPQTRRLLLLLNAMVTATTPAEGARGGYRFTRREAREVTGWGDTQLKTHLRRLVELEYLAVSHGQHGHRYELLYDGRGKDGERFLTGLIDPSSITGSHPYDAERAGSQAPGAAPGRPSGGGLAGGGRGTETDQTVNGSTGMSARRPDEG